jgi:hypothetical protein
MNQEPKQLPIPSLTVEQVQTLMNFANEQMPMKWGKEILAYIEKVAVDLEEAKTPQPPISAE